MSSSCACGETLHYLLGQIQTDHRALQWLHQSLLLQLFNFTAVGQANANAAALCEKKGGNVTNWTLTWNYLAVVFISRIELLLLYLVLSFVSIKNCLQLTTLSSGIQYDVECPLDKVKLINSCCNLHLPGMADSVRMEMPLGYVTLESGRVQRDRY